MTIEGTAEPESDSGDSSDPATEGEGRTLRNKTRVNYSDIKRRKTSVVSSFPSTPRKQTASTKSLDSTRSLEEMASWTELNCRLL
jgi:hypothetical protein